MNNTVAVKQYEIVIVKCDNKQIYIRIFDSFPEAIEKKNIKDNSHW